MAHDDLQFRKKISDLIEQSVHVLRQALDEGLTFAEMLLKLYREKWNGSLEPLWEEIEFWPDND